MHETNIRVSFPYVVNSYGIAKIDTQSLEFTIISDFVDGKKLGDWIHKDEIA